MGRKTLFLLGFDVVGNGKGQWREMVQWRETKADVKICLSHMAYLRRAREKGFFGGCKRVKVLRAVASAADTILIDTVLTKALLIISLFSFP